MKKAAALQTALMLGVFLGASPASAACLSTEAESNNSEQKANSLLCSGAAVSGKSGRDHDQPGA